MGRSPSGGFGQENMKSNIDNELINDHPQHTSAMNETAAAQLLGMSVATLRAWRHRKQGPRFVKFGRSVRYLSADLETFIEGSRA
jgi:predicted DNA-binding transcriptional regulator AlpA